MGKTEKGAIWLDENMMPPYEYWQFWRNTSDEDVVKFLKYFTEINIEDLNLEMETFLIRLMCILNFLVVICNTDQPMVIKVGKVK